MQMRQSWGSDHPYRHGLSDVQSDITNVAQAISTAVQATTNPNSPAYTGAIPLQYGYSVPPAAIPAGVLLVGGIFALWFFAKRIGRV